MSQFNQTSAFTYNHKQKVLGTLIWFAGIALITAAIISYIQFFKDTDILLFKLIEHAANHVSRNMDLPLMTNSTLLGVFYSSLIGGLFFVFMSMEALFINLLRTSHPAYLVMAVYLLGILSSYTANYFIGMRLSNFAKKAVSPQKFYKIKGLINKYGALAIFILNVGPLPSQPLSAILGAVKYNKIRFYVYSMAGQIVKYGVITLGLQYFL
jgi:membrane protein YqaA with SNARE-associated domain